jgi:hypothetical protein
VLFGNLRHAGACRKNGTPWCKRIRRNLQGSASRIHHSRPRWLDTTPLPDRLFRLFVFVLGRVKTLAAVARVEYHRAILYHDS